MYENLVQYVGLDILNGDDFLFYQLQIHIYFHKMLVKRKAIDIS